MAQLIQALPDDATVVGFGEDPSYGTCYILVNSKRFKEVREGERPNEIIAHFDSQWSEAWGYQVVFRRLDMSEALDNTGYCYHEYKEYVGVMDRYNYCTKCGAKEKK